MKALSTLLKSKKLDRKKTIPTHQQRRHQCHKQQAQDQACDQQHGDLHTFQLLETLLLLLHPLEFVSRVHRVRESGMLECSCLVQQLLYEPLPFPQTLQAEISYMQRLVSL
jgi:hypothetical protein